jgi:hypothetical protein
MFGLGTVFKRFSGIPAFDDDTWRGRQAITITGLIAAQGNVRQAGLQ